MKEAYRSQDRRTLTGPGRDGVYAVNLKLMVQGKWGNMGVIGYQIGRKRETIGNLSRPHSALGRGGIRNPVSRGVALANQRLRLLGHRGNFFFFFLNVGPQWVPGSRVERAGAER